MHNLAEATVDQKRRDQKTGLMGGVGSGVAILRQAFLTWQVNRLITRMCPNKTMSCIGKFRRNAINYKENLAWTIFFLFGTIVHVIFNEILTRVQISPNTKFYLDILFWIVFTEIPVIYLIIILNMRETPILKKTPKVQFYVLNPSFLPRRLFEGKNKNTCEPLQQVKPQDGARTLGMVHNNQCANLIIVHSQEAETIMGPKKPKGQKPKGRKSQASYHPHQIKSLSSAENSTVSNNSMNLCQHIQPLPSVQ